MSTKHEIWPSYRKNSAKNGYWTIFEKITNFCPLFGAKLAKFRDFGQFETTKTKQYEFLKHYIWYRQTDGIPF